MSRRFLHSSAGFLFIRPIRIRPRSIPVRRLLSLQSTSDPRRPLKDRQQESARRNKAVCCGAEQSLLSKYFQFTSNIHTMSSQPVPEAAAAAPEVSQSRASGAEASCAAASEKTAVAPSAPEPEPKLPPLSAAEYREYNRLADSMEYFVSFFFVGRPGTKRPQQSHMHKTFDIGTAHMLIIKNGTNEKSTITLNKHGT